MLFYVIGPAVVGIILFKNSSASFETFMTLEN